MKLKEYYHSVTLRRDKCRGCTNCIKRCPTEAIRVRDGKARIIAERCIDCGECIRVCPYHAKVAVTDPLSSIERFRYRIALPAPTLYGQFKNVSDINVILAGLKNLGFDYVYEVARGADYVTAFVKQALKDPNRKRPIISSSCPAIVRLIQVRFPELIDNIVDVDSPMEITAQLARNEFCEKYGVKPEEVGVFFITPCAAKMTSIRNPVGRKESSVDGAISIQEIYGQLYNQISKLKREDVAQMASPFGVGWANSGGESLALGIDSYLAVDGIQNVIRVLEEIEDDKLTDLEYFEGLACPGGCVGGPLTVENGFVAKNRIRKLSEKAKGRPVSEDELHEVGQKISWRLDEKILPKPVMKLDDDIVEAMKKMETIKEIYESLPGLDCGSCGSPSCRTLAEDIVRGYASEMDCVFKLREKVKQLALEMIELSEKIPGGRKEKERQE
ncbi:MAG: [Fe-Fe] hydrogenase large subunit C-terminal domain-containing protein [Caldicoprobacter oshimai]|uniref:Iron only hydrogenase large subunit, C-terminal domain n=1 Tax=Caldicoprobacter faecalis TaxID=937334 RepID=A0A1I5SIP7_9FIRM|nr:MAG: 4Fe-4S dicluster domain-containing protein [Caldicoprobacter oshimai]SFP70531.1 Iron only hydrogenase large subunit, C-terminal domain [Caldicoprobacter faecalis]